MPLKKCCVQKNVGPKIFWSEKILDPKKVPSENVFVQQKFGTKKILGHKRFWAPEKFQSEKNCCPLILIGIKWVRIFPEMDWYHYQGACLAPTCIVQHQTLRKTPSRLSVTSEPSDFPLKNSWAQNTEFCLMIS